MDTQKLKKLLKELQRLKAVKDSGALAGLIFDLTEKIEGFKGDKGDKGDKGEKGDKGDKGEKGDSIRGIQGEKGERGERGFQGSPGLDGLDGKDGKDGRDGDELTAEEVRDKLETLKDDDRLDIKYIKGWEDELSKVKVRGGTGGLRPAPTGIETPSGAINGVNTAYSVQWKPQFITLNGQAIYEGSGWALSAVAGVLTITLDSAPLTGGVLRSHY